jgi:hypothetical protein
LGQQYALQKHLLQEISKPENKELQTAVKTYSEDMIGQYFQRIEDLRVEKGFDDITSMYDASRQQADNGVLTAQIGNLTKCLINDFTGDDQELLIPLKTQVNKDTKKSAFKDIKHRLVPAQNKVLTISGCQEAYINCKVDTEKETLNQL